MYAARANRATFARLSPWHQTPPGGRLIRRWRWPALGVVAVAVLVMGYGRLAADGREVTPASTTVVTVAPGDTLWGIAVRQYPDADPRQKVAQIERLNALNGPEIEAGQRLRLPVA
jgi:nucleoid-associated protein YgaU